MKQDISEMISGRSITPDGKIQTIKQGQQGTIILVRMLALINVGEEVLFHASDRPVADAVIKFDELSIVEHKAASQGGNEGRQHQQDYEHLVTENRPLRQFGGFVQGIKLYCASA